MKKKIVAATVTAAAVGRWTLSFNDHTVTAEHNRRVGAGWLQQLHRSVFDQHSATA